MNKFLISCALFFFFSSCTNTSDLKTGEIEALQLFKNVIKQPSKSNVFIDARDLLSRKQIDAANIPILFVQLKSGQNGTLTPYPGQGVGQTWLGADGATITLERGILKASRGMGEDLMGATLTMPPWTKLTKSYTTYYNETVYMTGNNKLSKHILACKIKKVSMDETIYIWQVSFVVNKYLEKCNHNRKTIENVYYVDKKGVYKWPAAATSSAMADPIGSLLS